MVNRRFLVNLVLTGPVPSQLSMKQGRKLGVQGSEAVDITVGDNFYIQPHD